MKKEEKEKQLQPDQHFLSSYRYVGSNRPFSSFAFSGRAAGYYAFFFL